MKPSLKPLFLVLLTLPVFGLNSDNDLHKFYVSTTIIEENILSNSIEITIKIFSDDLERVLEKSATEPIFLGDEKENERAEEWIELYVKKHFNLEFNDRSFEMRYLGKEVEFDLTYLYFEIAPNPGFTSLKIRNSLMMDEFEEQVNIVHLRFSGWEQRLMIDAKRPEIVVSR